MTTFEISLRDPRPPPRGTFGRVLGEVGETDDAVAIADPSGPDMGTEAREGSDEGRRGDGSSGAS